MLKKLMSVGDSYPRETVKVNAPPQCIGTVFISIYNMCAVCTTQNEPFDVIMIRFFVLSVECNPRLFIAAQLWPEQIYTINVMKL